jgi:HlyD family secretion protein
MKFKELGAQAITFIKRNILLSLGVIGLIAGIIFSFTLGNPASTPPNQLSLPPAAHFDQNVSGIGFVEANTENISVGAFTSGIVEEVFVKAGDQVQKDSLLFTLDRRTALAEIALQEKELQVKQSEILIAEVDLEEKKEELRRAKALKLGREISQSELKKRQFAFARAETQLSHGLKELDQAKAKLNLAKVTLEKLTVRAPVKGTILKIRVHPGEFISENSPNYQAPILMGAIHPFHLRVQIDENDVWRFKSNASAYAYLRSHKEVHFPLAFVRLDPYVQPKKQLSGDSAERVDTRILEIIYRIKENPFPIYIGQQFDVFIEATQGP